MSTNTRISNMKYKYERIFMLNLIKPRRASICLLLVLASALLTTSCNIIRPCVESFCGCWRSTTIKYRTTVLNSENRPVEGIELFCPDTSKVLGSTNKDGKLAVRINTKISPACGISTCSKLSVLQNQLHIGYVHLGLSKSNQGILLIKEIKNQHYETHNRR